MSGPLAPEARYPSGRRKVPLGIRKGGAAYERLHAEIARIGLQILARDGYADMAMEDVALAVGASKRTLYRHFPTKLDLALAAIEQIPTFTDVEIEGNSTSEEVRTFLERVSGYDPGFIPVLATAIAQRTATPQLLEALRERVLRPREQVFAKILERGQDRGEIDPDISPAAASALATGILIDHWAGLHVWDDDDPGIEYAFSVIWPALRANPDAGG